MKKQVAFVFIAFLQCTTLLHSQCVYDWQTVGLAAFSTSSVSYCSVASDGKGKPYLAFVDATHGGRATVMRFNGTFWDTVGQPGLSAASVLWTSIALDGSGTPYVTYVDALNPPPFYAKVKKFNGTSWVYVGSGGFSAGTAYNTMIKFDPFGTPYVTYSDVVNGVKTSVMKFNGTAWVQVGTAGFSAGQSNYNSIALDPAGTPYVAYVDWGNAQKITVMKFNGTSWVNVGLPGFSAGIAYYTSIAIDGTGTPYVAYSDNAYGNKVTVKKFNGTSWVTVGINGFSFGNSFYTTIDIDQAGTPYVVYQDLVSTSYKATVQKFDGTAWVVVGSQGFSAGNVQYTYIDIDSSQTAYVAYNEYDNNQKATVMKFTLSPTVTATGQTVCAGSPAAIVPGGAITYSISGGSFTVTPPQTTSYTVTGTSLNGCTDTAIVTVPVKPLPAINITGNFTLCQGESGTLTASGADTYSWNTGESSADISISAGGKTIFTVQGTGINGCKGTSSVAVVISECTQLEEYTNDQIEIFPNPANEMINVSAAQPITKIEIFDHSGRQVRLYSPGSKNFSQVENTLPAGFYLFRITVAENKTVKKMVVISR